VGIDVEPIVERPTSFDSTVFTAAERTLLDRWSGSSRAEWVTRFWCAKQAAAKASGSGFVSGPASAEVFAADQDTGVIHVHLGPELLRAWPDGLCDQSVCVVSARRADRAWGWAIGKGIKP
jgi:phosphopantetheinyl transferase